MVIYYLAASEEYRLGRLWGAARNLNLRGGQDRYKPPGQIDRRKESMLSIFVHSSS